MTRILFLHDLESGPQGNKPRALRGDVQLHALERAEPGFDVVVGSSFRRCALELLQRGAWRGPTVLLCPAHERVAERA